jgi:uncharacterized protein (TIGR00645 family)
MWRPLAEKVEHILETVVFASRWLLAPFYLGLALSLGVLLVAFTKEFLHLAIGAFQLAESDVILGVLALVDLALTGSLLVIVIFSGYENFVSKIDHSGHKDWPEWMGTIDFGALKLKLLSSIVAISAIQLLKQFMSIKTVTPETERTLFWMVIIHVVFVISSVLLALSDRIAGHGNAHGETDGGSHGQTSGAQDTSGAAKAVMAAASHATPPPAQGHGKGKVHR